MLRGAGDALEVFWVKRGEAVGYPGFEAFVGGKLNDEDQALEIAGRWTTPPFATQRFDTSFFLARVPAGQEPTILPGELPSGEWIAPRAALERWKRGETTLAAPILHHGRTRPVARHPQHGRTVLRLDPKAHMRAEPRVRPAQHRDRRVCRSSAPATRRRGTRATSSPRWTPRSICCSSEACGWSRMPAA